MIAVMIAGAAAAPLAADNRALAPHGANAAVRATATNVDAVNYAVALSAADNDAAKDTGFAVPRHVIASGGGSSSGGGFAISGTIGQRDADPLHPATGGVFAISGGFWPGSAPGAPIGDAVFANSFEPTSP